MLLMGDKDIEAGTVSVRKRGEGDIGAVSPEAFVEMILKDVKEKSIW